MMSDRRENKKLVIWMRFKPESTDPLDYDLNVHHVTMRSIYSSLVSMYENGKISPQIAKKWESNQENDSWKVTIGDNLYFSNGDLITPEIVLKTFKRLIWVKNKTESRSGLLEFLKGFNSLKNIDDEFEGIQIKDKNLVFKFIKPMPNFLEKISFGFYSIVHPSQFDKLGKWINKKSSISSGVYEISKWSDEEFVLKIRKNLQNFNYDKKIESIEFNFSQDPGVVLKSDIVLRERANLLVSDDDWYYASTLEDSNIVYVKVMKWNDPKSIYSNVKTRRSLRKIFYKGLINSGFTPTKSFFPLSIKGVKEFNDLDGDEVSFHKIESITMPPFFNPLKSEQNKDKKDLGEVYKLGFENFCKVLGAKYFYHDYPEKLEDEKEIFDLQYLGTGIEVNDPNGDIEFMFLSKHGINLPDSSGKILGMLANKKFEVQDINSEIWNQAIIWPIRHYSQGFWVKKKSNIDLSSLNLSMDPIDFQFLSWK